MCVCFICIIIVYSNQKGHFKVSMLVQVAYIDVMIRAKRIYSVHSLIGNNLVFPLVLRGKVKKGESEINKLSVIAWV